MDLDQERVLALPPSASSKRIINPNIESHLFLQTDLMNLAEVRSATGRPGSRSKSAGTVLQT